MKNFNEWLNGEKKTTKEQFNELEDTKKLELQNEYNDYLKSEFESATKDNVTKEMFEEWQKNQNELNEQRVKTLENIALAVKAMAEKAGVSNVEELEKHELIQMIEKNAGLVNEKGSGRANSFNVKVDAEMFLGEVTKAAAQMTTANITGATWSPLFANYVDANVYGAPQPVSPILQDVRVVAQDVENIYWTERTNEQGNATWVAEAGLKPLIDADWVTTSIQTAEIAERWKITTRTLFHAKSSVQDFQKHAQDLMNRGIANGALNGTGVAPQAKGVSAYASAFVAPTSMAVLVPLPNAYDAIVACATQIRTSGHKGQIVAYLPADYEGSLRTTLKRTDGQYIVPPFVTPDGTNCNGVIVRFDVNMTSGKILVGVLSNYTFVVSGVVFDEGYENDDFSKNLISRKAEAFGNGYLPSELATSVVYDDIATIITAIKKP